MSTHDPQVAHESRSGQLEAAHPSIEDIPIPPARCDAACPAAAQVFLILSAAGELAFCQHHYREHERALMVGGWQRAS
jgi:hypothetical protein